MNFNIVKLPIRQSLSISSPPLEWWALVCSRAHYNQHQAVVIIIALVSTWICFQISTYYNYSYFFLLLVCGTNSPMSFSFLWFWVLFFFFCSTLYSVDWEFVCARSRFAWFHANISSPEENAIFFWFASVWQSIEKISFCIMILQDKCNTQCQSKWMQNICIWWLAKLQMTLPQPKKNNKNNSITNDVHVSAILIRALGWFAACHYELSRDIETDENKLSSVSVCDRQNEMLRNSNSVRKNTLKCKAVCFISNSTFY